MPFQSEKQRRYMHANLPDIAKRWERDYAGGGFIPSHEAGIYGLAEGGQLVKPGPGRQGYNGGDPVGGYGPGGSWNGGGGNGTPTVSTTAASEDIGVVDTIADLTEDYDEPDRAHEIQTQRAIKKGIKELKSRDQYDTRLTREQKKQVNAELAAHYGDKPGTKYDLADWGADKAWGQKKSGIWGMLGKGILTLGTAGAGAGLFGKDLAQAVTWLNRAKNIKKGIAFAKEKGWLDKKLQLNNLKLTAALPKGHPERIQKEGLKKEPILPERDNGRTQETEPTITMDVEAVNDANAEKARLLRKYQEMEWAAYRAKLEQQEMEAKKQAWLRQLRQTYMSAQGGRVPAGYNTGGLSNLFKLRNV